MAQSYILAYSPEEIDEKLSTIDKFHPLVDGYPNLMTKSDIEQGALSSSGLISNSDYTKRLRTKGYINVIPGTYLSVDWECADTLAYSVSFFTVADWSTGRINYTGWLEKNTVVAIPGNVNYVRVTWRKGDGSSQLLLDELISITTNVTPLQKVVESSLSVDGLTTIVGKTFGTLSKNEVEQGSMTSKGNNESTTSGYFYRRLRTIGRIKIVPGYPFAVSWDGDPSLNITCYVKYFANESSTQFAQTSWAPSGTVVIPPKNAEYIRINWRKNDETNLSMDEVENIRLEYDTLTTSMATLLVEGNLVAGENYLIDGLFSKRNLTVEEIGTITYPQAFCIYNDCYYSTNGSKIAVQNAQFELVNEVEIALAHGNSMHLGKAHPNYAYVSGWNDQKVYVVDLDTLTIAQTINLPTTGYTTVAVDDVNQIAYIFQRTTNPNTEDRYNFITYNYSTEETLSTRVLERPFAAMQACDYLEGKIIVLNGLGTAAAPNYYLAYNTSGDIIQEFVLGTFATQEPEGVYIDRKTRELYMNMYASKKLYRIK